MKTVADLNSINGQWISDYHEVCDINQELNQWFESYFMVEPEDGGRSGSYQLYGCNTNIPYLVSGIKGPFVYPR
jgi:hypothetical protein